MIDVCIKHGRTAAPPSIEEVMAGADPRGANLPTIDGLYVEAWQGGWMEPAEARDLAYRLIANAALLEPQVLPAQEEFVPEPEPAPKKKK